MTMEKRAASLSFGALGQYQSFHFIHRVGWGFVRTSGGAPADMEAGQNE
jgi:hypothetical protein